MSLLLHSAPENGFRFLMMMFIRLRRRPWAAYSAVVASGYEGWIRPWMNAKGGPAEEMKDTPGVSPGRLHGRIRIELIGRKPIGLINQVLNSRPPVKNWPTIFWVLLIPIIAVRIKPEMLCYGLQVLGFLLVICSLADQTPNQRLLFSRQDAKQSRIKIRDPNFEIRNNTKIQITKILNYTIR